MKILKIFLLLSSLFLFVNADDDKYEHTYKNLEYLNLSDTQLTQMKSILIEYKYKYKKYYEYEEEEDKKLQKIMEADYFDKEQYLNISKEIKTKAFLLETEKMEKIHKILTKSQRKSFAKYLEEWEID